MQILALTWIGQLYTIEHDAVQQFSVKHRVLIYQGVKGIEATIFRNALVV